MTSPQQLEARPGLADYPVVRQRVREIIRILNRDSVEPQELLLAFEEGCRRLMEMETILSDTRLLVREIEMRYGVNASDGATRTDAA